MEQKEKRWSKRMDINATIKLKSIRNERMIFEPNQGEFDVNVINISKGGMAFTTKELLPLNSYYDAKVILWTKDNFEAVLEIIRMENEDVEGEITYGCKFIGLNPSQQFKIDVYEIVNEPENI